MMIKENARECALIDHLEHIGTDRPRRLRVAALRGCVDASRDAPYAVAACVCGYGGGK